VNIVPIQKDDVPYVIMGNKHYIIANISYL